MTTSEHAPRRTHRRRRRLIAAAVVGVVLLAAVGAALAGWFAGRIQRPYRNYEGADRFVEIEPGMGVNAIGRRLVAAGIVPDLFTYRIAVRVNRAERSLKAGEYRFDKAISPLGVVARLVRGDVYLRAITFPEGLTIREMAEHYEASGFGTADAFKQAAGLGSLVGDLDGRAPDLEGYLFPDTYRLPRKASAEDLVRAMVARFRQVLGPGQRARSRERGHTVREILTLASLVEKETAVPEERPLVAAVYANRLKIGMGMQCDPTVIYALMRAGRWTGNITRADLAFDSPYNTYKYAGLPPGPIASPGKASIDAALAPADVPYLYFVSRNDGSHAFAATLAEHNRNVREYQLMYFRQKRLQERRETAGDRVGGNMKR